VLIEEDEVDGLGVLGEEAEVGAFSIPGRAQGVVNPRPGSELYGFFLGSAGRRQTTSNLSLQSPHPVRQSGKADTIGLTYRER
jgi:hypothetical protein